MKPVAYIHVFAILITLVLLGCSNPSTQNGGANDPFKSKFQQESAAINITLSRPNAANIAVAQIISNLSSIEQKNKLSDSQQLLKELNQFNQKWAQLKHSLIVGDKGLSSDPTIYSSSMNASFGQSTASSSFNHDIAFKAVTAIESQALHNIIQIYNDSISEQSKYLAPAFLNVLQRERPDLLSNIIKTTNIKERSRQVQMIASYLREADKLLLAYDFSYDDQEKLIVYTAIAGTLAQHLSKHPDFTKLIENLRKLADLKFKIDQIILLSNSLKNYAEQTRQSSQEVFESAKKVVHKIQDYQSNLDLTLSKEGKIKAQALLSDVLNGQAGGKVSNVSDQELQEKGFFHRKHELSQSVQSFVSSSEKASASLAGIVQVTKSLSTLTGYELPQEVEQALDTATKISQGLQLANGVIAAYSSGGFVAALSAFSGGPATMALAVIGGGMGGSGPDPVVMAELHTIQRELAEVKELQKQILEYQKDTMVMIKDLAALSYEMHLAQMSALSDIRSDLATVSRAVNAVDMRDFQSCKVLISMPFMNASLNRYPSVRELNASNAMFIKKSIFDVTQSQEELVRFLNFGSSDHFNECKKELSKTFLSFDHKKFDRTIWAYEYGNALDGASIYETLFSPAARFLSFAVLSFRGSTPIKQTGLHLPSPTYDYIRDHKRFKFKSAVNIEEINNIYSLLAPHKLEEYVSALIILHPYLSLKSVDSWKSKPELIANEAVSEEALSFSRLSLANAYRLVESAIIQEAILSGEPMLAELSTMFSNILRETTPCQDPSKSTFCFARKNPLIMKNLLSYYLRASNGRDNFSSYEQHHQTQSLVNLAGLLGLPHTRLKAVDNAVFLILSSDKSLTVQLPTPQELTAGQVQYTNSMHRLLQLQQLLADEILKVTPQGLSPNELTHLRRFIN